MENQNNKKIWEMNNIRIQYFIFVAIIAVQLLVILYWANAKSNYFLDEFYSMGYASSYNGDSTGFPTASDNWKPKEWVNNAPFKKCLTIEKDEQIIHMPFFKALKKMVTGKNYFGFLNIAESIMGYSIVSIRPAITLNIIIFVFAEIALLVFIRKIKMDVRSQYLALAMFGFSGLGIGLVEFIRFYILVIMYLLWMLVLFYGVWNSNSLEKIIPMEFGILGLAYFAYRNSQLAMIFFGAFSFCFVIALMISKKWKAFIPYVALGLCGVAYIGATTDYIGILFHPTDYPEVKNKAVKASLNIATFSMDLVKQNLGRCVKFFGDSYFGNYFIVLMAAFALIAYSLWICRRKNRDELPAVSYNDKPDSLARTGSKLSLKNFKRDPESGFICVVFGTAVIYTWVMALSDLTAKRYLCIAFVLYGIVFWYVLDRILNKCPRKELVRGWYIILTAAVVLSALVPFKTRDVGIAYIYEDDGSFKAALELYRDMDVVLAFTQGTGAEIYDCINLMSEKSYIYAVDLEEYVYDDEKFTDEFLLWARSDQNVLPVLDDLTKRGYEFESLGENHASQAFVCYIKKNGSQ